jgi:hypothetical protein
MCHAHRDLDVALHHELLQYYGGAGREPADLDM